MKKYILGYVVGLIYPSDGMEWLTHKEHWCSLNPFKKDSHPTLYTTPDKARAVAEKLAKLQPRYEWFYRVYWVEVPNPDPAYHQKHYGKLVELPESADHGRITVWTPALETVQ
jgi:hypothetical protein